VVNVKNNVTIFESFFNFLKNNNNFNDCSENICHVIFYYIFCTSSLEKNNIFDFDLPSFKTTLEKVSSGNFENQNKVINAIVNTDLSFTRNFDFSVFNSTYGRKECKKFKIIILIKKRINQ